MIRSDGGLEAETCCPIDYIVVLYVTVLSQNTYSLLVMCHYIRLLQPKEKSYWFRRTGHFKGQKGTNPEAAETSTPASYLFVQTVCPSYTAISCFIFLKCAVFSLNVHEQM